MDLCEICKENMGIPTTTIVGGYIAIMCTRCRRHYHEFVLVNDRIRGHELKKATAEALVVLGDDKAIAMLDELLHERLEMYHIVEAWVMAQTVLYVKARADREAEAREH